jgi:hypothetical protein
MVFLDVFRSKLLRAETREGLAEIYVRIAVIGQVDCRLPITQVRR